MSIYREKIEKVHNNTDFRKTNAGVTELGEFTYKEHGGSVQPGLEYHIHYTNNKNEVFMLGGIHNPSSKIIEKVGGSITLFKQYNDLSSTIKNPYPKITPANPSEADYRIGKIKRYFAQSSITTNADIFEVSIDGFENQNTSYKYIEFDWRISGTRDEVIRDNQVTINFVNQELPGIIRKLFTLQFWRAPKTAPENLEKKVSLLKKF